MLRRAASIRQCAEGLLHTCCAARRPDCCSSPTRPAAGRNQYPQQGAAVFNFFANEEESSFHLVDNRPVKTAAQKFGGAKRFGQRNQQTQQQRREQAQRGAGARRRGLIAIPF